MIINQKYLTRIQLLKALTAVSFLLILVGGEKFSFFMGFGLLIAILNPDEVYESFHSYAISAFILYLYVSGNVKIKSKFDDPLCFAGIIAMQVFAILTLNFKYMGVAEMLFLLLFLILSCTVLVLIVYRRIIPLFRMPA